MGIGQPHRYLELYAPTDTLRGRLGSEDCIERLVHITMVEETRSGELDVKERRLHKLTLKDEQLEEGHQF